MIDGVYGDIASENPNADRVHAFEDAQSLMIHTTRLSQAQNLASLALFRSAIRREPGNALAWYNSGVCENIFGQTQKALEAYRRTLQLDPLNEGGLFNGAETIRVHEYFEEALILALRIEAFYPDLPQGYHNAAICLAHLERHDEADWHFEKAIALSADSNLIKWEYHHSLLGRKRFVEAWDAYSTRFACGHVVGVDDMAIELPDWTDQSLKGQHLVVYGEQGLGDQIMYASMFAELEASGAKISLLTNAPLAPLFAANFPKMTVMSIGNGLDVAQCASAIAELGRSKPVTLRIAMGSLMSRFRNDISQFPGKAYLSPSHEAQYYWNSAIASDDAVASLFTPSRKTAPILRVGLVWASNPAPERFFSSRRARNKTMPLSVMSELATVPGVSACSLTNVPLNMFEGADEAREAGIVDVANHLTDLDRTAALIQRLDLVITVDTSIAHLAGALGKPVWLLLHNLGDVRWGQRGETKSYWYDSMQIWWQNRPGDWPELIERVKIGLANKAQQSDV